MNIKRIDGFWKRYKSLNVSVLFQAAPPPPIDGIVKPMKPTGYSDSSADIAYGLKDKGIKVLTPKRSPCEENHKDWCFPDTYGYLEYLLNQEKSDIIWLNTILFHSHPVKFFLRNCPVFFIGQDPETVEKYDDKYTTNSLLASHSIPVPRFIRVKRGETLDEKFLNYNRLSFPLVAKPIRGRGSHGVTVVFDLEQLNNARNKITDTGEHFIIEDFLRGAEITVTVMPPGNYRINGEIVRRDSYWSLPPVERSNHVDNIAPYNGTVPVVRNSRVMNSSGVQVKESLEHCEKSARIIGALAPIRIDCRANEHGNFYLFDLNLKPNITGVGRKGREEMNSLSTMAANAIHWDYNEMLVNILAQAWRY